MRGSRVLEAWLGQARTVAAAIGKIVRNLILVQPLNAGVLVVEVAWSVLSLGIVVRAWQRRRVTGNVGHA